MMHCGLDFGTSNTTLGTDHNGRNRLVPLEGDNLTIPSALFYFEDNSEVLLGRDAMGEYLAGTEGRLMRSIKSVLGTSLMETSTLVGAKRIEFKDVIMRYLRDVKTRAETHLGHPLTCVVQGRPVRFTNGTDASNRAAESTLRDILEQVGFKHIHFQFEPIAAAYHFEQTLKQERLALVADIGGGTSDFTIIRIGPERAKAPERQGDVLGNHGLRLGGTDFDHLPSLDHIMPLLGYRARIGKRNTPTPNWIYTSLSFWPKINLIYAAKAARDIRSVIADDPMDSRLIRLETVLDNRLGHRIAMDVEGSKIALSDHVDISLDLTWLEAGLRHMVTQNQLDASLQNCRQELSDAVRSCVRISGARPADIDVVILTGGSTEMPLVQDAISGVLPDAVIQPSDKFGAVGRGLAVGAARLFS